MAHGNPPTGWVHTWLAPLYQWLLGLNAVVNTLPPATAGSAATTSATPATAATIPIPDGQTIFIEAKIAGITDDSSTGAAYIERAAFRNEAGVVSQIGLTSTDFVVEDDPAWVGGDYVISGTDVLVTVAGAAATNISWIVDITTHTAEA